MKRHPTQWDDLPYTEAPGCSDILVAHLACGFSGLVMGLFIGWLFWGVW
jgi:hypothetical protein